MTTTHLITQTIGGRWWVTTQSGSTYILDLDDMTVERAVATHELRRDAEVLPLFSVEPVVVGRPMSMFIDVVEDGKTVTHRHTSAVTGIWDVAAVIERVNN